jgi:hypothetical protein
MFILPLMLQVGFGMTAAHSGSLTFLAAVGSLSARMFLPALLRRLGFRRLLVTNTPTLAVLVAAFALLQPSTPIWMMAGLIIVFGALRSFQFGSAGNLSYADVPPESLARFSAMYYVTWQLAVALSIGATSALLAWLATDQAKLTPAEFHTAFVIASLVALSAVIAYLRLKPEDGRLVSGHKADDR